MGYKYFIIPNKMTLALYKGKVAMREREREVLGNDNRICIEMITHTHIRGELRRDWAGQVRPIHALYRLNNRYNLYMP